LKKINKIQYTLVSLNSPRVADISETERWTSFFAAIKSEKGECVGMCGFGVVICE